MLPMPEIVANPPEPVLLSPAFPKAQSNDFMHLVLISVCVAQYRAAGTLATYRRASAADLL
jgi:hypothetical protein